MRRLVVETLQGWAVFVGPPALRHLDAVFPTREEAERVARDRDNEEFWDGMRTLGRKVLGR